MSPKNIILCTICHLLCCLFSLSFFQQGEIKRKNNNIVLQKVTLCDSSLRAQNSFFGPQQGMLLFIVHNKKYFIYSSIILIIELPH